MIISKEGDAELFVIINLVQATEGSFRSIDEQDSSPHTHSQYCLCFLPIFHCQGCLELLYQNIYAVLVCSYQFRMGITPSRYHASRTHAVPYFSQGCLLTTTKEVRAISQMAADIPLQSLK